MKKRTIGISPWVIFVLMLTWSVRGLCAESDSVLAVAPLDYVLAAQDLDIYPGCVISPETLLVVVPEPETGPLLATGVISVVGPSPPEPLWIIPGQLPSEVALELGIDVLYTTESSTIFAADHSGSRAVRSKGYSVVEMEFRQVSHLKQPPLGVGVVQRLLEDRPLTEARKGFVQALSDSVDTLLIRSTIYNLTYDENRGEYRSRYACRSDLNRDIAPYIDDRLRAYVAPHGGQIVWQDCYGDTDRVCPDVPFRNLIGMKPGARTSAHYIICAHYDALASREPGWVWEEDPAPGADDNASGVAAMLECARLLSPLDLDVGLRFIAFSGEELGLLGSDCYVDGLAEEDSVLGVINFDMVGYVELEKRIEITYDWRSEWLSALIDETADTMEIANVVPFNRSGVYNSDHARFWAAGISGVMLADRTDDMGAPEYPHYHMLGDTLGNLSMDQVGDNVALVTGFLSRFAAIPEDTLSDLLLAAANVEWDWDERDVGQPLTAGESVTATIRAVNVGASMLQSESYDFEIWEGEPNRGRLIHASTPTIQVASGEPTRLAVSWNIDDQVYGNLVYSFALMPLSAGVESDVSNNSVSVGLEVMSQTGVLDNLHVFPNPILGGSDPKIAFDIFHPDGSDFKGTMEMWIFDLEGRRIGHGVLRNSYVGAPELGVGEGANVKPLSGFLTPDSDLAPGLYLCIAELRFVGESGRVAARSKFAVAR